MYVMIARTSFYKRPDLLHTSLRRFINNSASAAAAAAPAAPAASIPVSAEGAAAD